MTSTASASDGSGAAAGNHAGMVQLLRQRFGFSDFLPGQREVIAALQAEGRALAVFPTGGGKSICYQLPALAFEGVTIVVSPLIALMKDQIDWLVRHGIAAARLDSTLGAEQLNQVGKALEQGTLDLLYVAPERFQNERFLQLLGRLRIALFAVDEAHCISEWGHNFRPDYLKLASVARELRAERILALTATATPAVVRDICAAFGISDSAAIVTGFYRSNLELVIEETLPEERDARLRERLLERAPGAAIVYVTLQKTAERVAELLRGAGVDAFAYHAGLDPELRSKIQDDWMSKAASVVVATIAFGMGIDKANVRYVYHYNLPKSLESYSQEIGRAGRDGAPSVVELLACEADIPTLENFAYGDTPSEGALRGVVADLLGRGETFALNLTELGDRYDVRPLVLRTVLTYLELLGVFRQTTPFYAGYRLRPALPLEDLVAKFSGEPAQFLDALLRRAKRGRQWLSFDPEALAAELGQPRERVVRALEVIEERGHGVLEASDVRHRFKRLAEPEPEHEALGETRSPRGVPPNWAEVPNAQTPIRGNGSRHEALVAELSARFERREAQEVERIRQVFGLVRVPGCQTNALVAHFGELRQAPCGHCSRCRAASGRARGASVRELPRPDPAALAAAAGFDRDALRELSLAQPRALGEPRQLARFLCGITSPAASRARLSRHAAFGAVAECRFAAVLAFAESALDGTP